MRLQAGATLFLRMTVPCWDLQRNAGARRHIFITFLNNHLQDYTFIYTSGAITAAGLIW